MGWLSKSTIGLVALATLLIGCGSTSNDQLVLQFVGWDNTGLTQADSVGPNSADVDVIQDCCAVNAQNQCTSYEPFTQTTINAIFQNNQGLDITLNSYVIHFNNLPLGDITQTTSATIVGGRCAVQANRQCAVDSDCTVGGVPGLCTHTQTTITGLVLFDFQTKALVANPADLGIASPITVTFFGTDATNQSWQAVANYTVTFADYDNCSSGGGA